MSKYWWFLMSALVLALALTVYSVGRVRDSGPPVGFGVVYLFAAALFFGGFGLMGYALFAFKGVCRGVLFVLAVIIMFFGLSSLIWWGVLCDRCNGKSENCAGVKKQAEDSEIPPKFSVDFLVT